MNISKLECPSCGAAIKEVNGKAYCEYCGREAIIESKVIEEIGKTVGNTIEQSGVVTQEAIKSGSENTQIELRRLQMSQELSTLQMQLSNLRSEKRSLSLVQKKTRTHKKQLQEIDEEERNILSHINLIQSTFYPQQNQSKGNYSVSISKPGKPRSQSVAILLAFFLGMFGVHRFYTGHKTLGFLYLFTAGVGGIGWAIDILLLLLNAYKDADGRPLTPMRPIVFKIFAFIILATFIQIIWIASNPNAQPSAMLASYVISLIIVNLKSIWIFASKKLKKSDQVSG